VTEPFGGRRPRTVEIELDPPRLAMLFALLLLALSGAFWFGRLTAPGGRGGLSGAVTPAGQAGTAPAHDVAASASLFDREGPGGATPEPKRELARDASRQGRFALAAGQAPTRREAEALAAKIRALGLPVLLTRTATGRYEIAAGPFSSREEAERVRPALERGLRRPVRLTGGP